MDTKGCSTPTRNSSIWSLKTKQCLLSGILIMVPFAISNTRSATRQNLCFTIDLVSAGTNAQVASSSSPSSPSQAKGRYSSFHSQ
jgi:hypothetical protein